MKASFKTGLSFGLTSVVITTLRLMVGLHSGTRSRTVVIGGILTIAMLMPCRMPKACTFAEESKNNGVVSKSGNRPSPPLWQVPDRADLCRAGAYVAVRGAMTVSVGWGLTLLRGAEAISWHGPSRSRPGKSFVEHVVIASA